MEPTTTKRPPTKMKLKLRLSRFKSTIKVFHRLVKKKNKNKKLTKTLSSRKVIIASSKDVYDDATDKNSTDDKSIQKDMPSDTNERPGADNGKVILVEEGKGNYDVYQGDIIDVINTKATPKVERIEEEKTNGIKFKDTTSKSDNFSVNVPENTPQDISENASTKSQEKHEEDESQENNNSIINIYTKTEVENMENKNVNNNESKKSQEETEKTCGSEIKDASSNTTEDHGMPGNTNPATKKDIDINNEHINERMVVKAPNVEDHAFDDDEIDDKPDMADQNTAFDESQKPVSALKDWLVDFGRENRSHYEKNIVKNSIAARFSDANQIKRELFVKEMRAAAAEEGDNSDDSDEEELWTDDDDEDKKENEPKLTPGNKGNKKKKKRHSLRHLKGDVVSFRV